MFLLSQSSLLTNLFAGTNMEEEVMTPQKAVQIYRDVFNDTKEAITKILVDAKYTKYHRLVVAGFFSISCEQIAESIKSSLLHFEEGRGVLTFVEDIDKLIRQELA